MKRIFALLTVVALLLTCAACSGGGDAQPTTTTQTDPTTATTVSQVTGKPQNVLTGAYDIPEGDPSRPVAIMVPNDSKVVGNQVEIDKADFYFECETEGAIPRLLTAFGSVKRIPDMYGPVRSARTPFLATARSLGAVYVHAGGSSGADALLNAGVIDRINALSYGAPYFWRDQDLWNRMDKEHSMVTGDELVELLGKKEFATTPVKQPIFTFGDKKGSDAANTMQINSTPSQRVTFIYDAATGLYGKNIGTIKSNKPHTSLAGNQIKVSNVIVLYAERFAESKQHINFKEGSGTAYLFSGGTYRKVTFNRTDESLSFTEADGTPAVFAEGKTYMILAEQSLEKKLVIE